MKLKLLLLLNVSIAGLAFAEEELEKTNSQQAGVKTLSGMSILGNDEAPTSLVIVPWKSSELGDGIGIGNLLDERASPVDKEVFMRELSYYELRASEIRSSNSDELADSPMK